MAGLSAIQTLTKLQSGDRFAADYPIFDGLCPVSLLGGIEPGTALGIDA